MKRLLVLIVFLMCPLLSFADEVPQAVEANHCTPAQPLSSFYTPEEIKAGLGSKDTSCGNQKPTTYCVGNSACCVDHTGYGRCCPYSRPGNTCCAGSDNKTCCDAGTHCNPDGSVCLPNAPAGTKSAK